MSASCDFIVELAQSCQAPPARLLDFGCGNGAGERIRRVGASEDLPFADGWFDLVVTNQVIERLRDPAPALGEIARVLRRLSVEPRRQ